MGCEIVRGKDFRGFQCHPGDSFMRPMSYKEICGMERLEPYFEDECRHEDRFDDKGILRCAKCSMIYDENSLSWISAPKEY